MTGEVSGIGPLAAVKQLRLQDRTAEERQAWVESARLDAILGVCSRTIPSLKSGIRCYIAFVDSLGGRRDAYFPPKLDDLLAWSTLFRSEGTLANYLSFVRTACILVKAPVDVFCDPALARAKGSVAKAQRFAQRQKFWIQRDKLELVLLWCSQHAGFEKFAALFLLSYAFLLRLPSEALPAVAGSSDAQSSLTREGDQLVLVLKRRKNKPGGSRLCRGCWCEQSKLTCPVHVLGPVLDACAAGDRLFEGITAASALATLRVILEDCGLPNARAYRTHDLRRGHALDLQVSGAPLYEILAAGEWRSPAFLSYLDFHRLETDLVVQAHINESEGEDEIL